MFFRKEQIFMIRGKTEECVEVEKEKECKDTLKNDIQISVQKN